MVKIMNISQEIPSKTDDILLPNPKILDTQIKCFEIHNLYYESEEEVKSTSSILLRLSALESKYGDSLSYFYILHDNDTYDTDSLFDDNHIMTNKVGTYKKPHYHLYVELPSYHTLKSISQWFDVDYRNVWKFSPKELPHKVRYLWHLAHPDKFQYPFNFVTSNKMDYCRYLYDTFIPKSSPTNLILKYLDLNKGNYISLESAANYLKFDESHTVITEQEFLKSWIFCKDLINEHNKNVYDYDSLDDLKNSVINRFHKNQKAYQDKVNAIIDAFGICTTEEGYTISKPKYTNRKGNKL